MSKINDVIERMDLIEQQLARISMINMQVSAVLEVVIDNVTREYSDREKEQFIIEVEKAQARVYDMINEIDKDVSK